MCSHFMLMFSLSLLCCLILFARDFVVAKCDNKCEQKFHDPPPPLIDFSFAFQVQEKGLHINYISRSRFIFLIFITNHLFVILFFVFLIFKTGWKVTKQNSFVSVVMLKDLMKK